jgi:hypothetical protein
MLFNNIQYFSLQAKRLYLALLGALGVQQLLIGFLTKKCYDFSRMEAVYVVFPDQTFAASRPESSLVRSEYELEAFAKLFLEKALAHHEYSWEENVKQAAGWMDKESARLFLSKMDETVKSLYKERNAVSTVSLKRIEIDKKRHPHEVVIYYTSSLKFTAAGSTVYEDIEIPGGMYFQLVLLKRSHQNPYGLQIKNLKFLQPEEAARP